MLIRVANVERRRSNDRSAWGYVMSSVRPLALQNPGSAREGREQPTMPADERTGWAEWSGADAARGTADLAAAGVGAAGSFAPAGASARPETGGFLAHAV